MTLLLSNEEITELTGYKVPALQLEVLHRRGFYRACMGRKGVVLTRAHFESRATKPEPAPEPAPIAAPSKWIGTRSHAAYLERLQEREEEVVRSQAEATKERDERAARDQAQRDHYEAMRPVHRAALVRHHAAKRRVAKLKRTPPWANQDAIKAIYAEALRLTRETGIEHHVDHTIPLQGKLVSGLHVENNLQVLPWRENVMKRNHFEVE